MSYLTFALSDSSSILHSVLCSRGLACHLYVTEELKRFTRQEMARGFSLFEEALLVFEA